MLWIHAAGAAYPSTIITNRFLEDLQGGAPMRGKFDNSHIESRRSVLPADYLRLTKNQDIRIGQMVAAATPTSLGVQAVQHAIGRSNISLEDIALILGDSTSQLQLIPTEGQRIAGGLGLRIPAYDIVGATGAFALHLQNVLHWKPARLPKIFASVSANAPTAFIDYSQGDAGAYLGDGAGAVILSASIPQGLTVREVKYRLNSKVSKMVESDLSEPIRVDGSTLEKYMHERSFACLREAFEAHTLDPKTTKVIGCEFNLANAIKGCESLGIPAENYFTTGPTTGHCIGSSIYGALAEHWDVIIKAPHTVITFAGAGPCEGYVLLEGVK